MSDQMQIPEKTPYFLDLGRSLWKTANNGRLTLTTIAGVNAISMADYDEAMERNHFCTANYIIVNGQPYVVGDQASWYGVLSRKATSARYSREDFGIAAISSILRYGFESQFVNLVVSHPPSDGQYKDKMRSALLGEWEIESYNTRVCIDVCRVLTEEEPVALLRYLQLPDSDGQVPPAILSKRCLIIDGGGQTLDITATDSKNNLVNALTGSRPIGINQYLINFEKAIRARYRDAFAETENIDPVAIRDAFATGIFIGGGQTYDCMAEATQQKADYLNRAMNFIRDKTGGVVNFDTIAIGGGAAGLLNGDFKDALQHGNVHYVDSNLDQIHEAGVKGLRKQYAQWQKMNLV